MPNKEFSRILRKISGEEPVAKAVLKGSALMPGIHGNVEFYPAMGGTMVVAEVTGLPVSRGKKQPGPYGFHIHEGKTCGLGFDGNAFSSAGGHYNPTNQQHPFHAGDLPVLFSNNGVSYMVVFTNRFKPRDVIGRTVIIHDMPDDFRSQPSGDSGGRMACGVIKANARHLAQERDID